MQLWVEDKYVPKSKQTKSKKSVSAKEWSSEDKNTTKIGVTL